MLLKIFTAGLLLFCLHAASADTLTGRVVAVSDGDTITLLDATNQQHKIRLAAIDTPERGQPFGQAAKQSIADQVFDRQVTVETSKLDRYGRVIGKVLIDGKDANLEQLRRGLGWHYKKYQNEQPLDDRLAYTRAEEEARATRRGLWSDDAPVAPWDWRHSRKH